MCTSTVRVVHCTILYTRGGIGNIFASCSSPEHSSRHVLRGVVLRVMTVNTVNKPSKVNKSI